MKKLLVFLAGVALASSISGAGAYFTDETSVAENVIRIGEVAVSAEPSSAALYVEALAPGTTVTQPMTIFNDGTLPSTVVVTGAKKMGFTDVYEALGCRVTHEGVMVYEGPLSGLSTTPVAVDPGSSVRLDFEVSLPADAGNDLAGDYVKMTLYVDAEQAH